MLFTENSSKKFGRNFWPNFKYKKVFFSLCQKGHLIAKQMTFNKKWMKKKAFLSVLTSLFNRRSFSGRTQMRIFFTLKESSIQMSSQTVPIGPRSFQNWSFFTTRRRTTIFEPPVMRNTIGWIWEFKRLCWIRYYKNKSQNQTKIQRFNRKPSWLRLLISTSSVWLWRQQRILQMKRRMFSLKQINWSCTLSRSDGLIWMLR